MQKLLSCLSFCRIGKLLLNPPILQALHYPGGRELVQVMHCTYIRRGAICVQVDSADGVVCKSFSLLARHLNLPTVDSVFYIIIRIVVHQQRLAPFSLSWFVEHTHHNVREGTVH
jgi:hypothetical protein